MSNLTGYIKHLYHGGNESPGCSLALDNTGALWQGRGWGRGVEVALLQLRGSYILVPTWVGQTQALLGQAPGSLLALSSVSGRPCES